jgi:uncharacterized protein YcnI
MKACQPLRLILVLSLVLLAPPAWAQIILSETKFEAGSRYAAFFKVEHGCGASPTVSLEVQIPAGVTVLQLPEKPGWTLSAKRVGVGGKQQISAVTWHGRLETESRDQFGLLLQLPPQPGPLYFPVIQHCVTGETRWTDIPTEGHSPRDLLHPAPVLSLTASAQPGPSDHDHH